MNDDDFQRLWAAHGARLEHSVSVNEHLLRGALLREARGALTPYFGWRALELVLGAGLLFAIGPVVARHLGEPRYALLGSAAILYVALLIALTGYLLGRGASLRYERPVTELRHELDRLALVEYHGFKWALLGGVVTWLPIVLLALEALSGVDLLARVDGAWLLGNVAVGAALLGLGQLAARRLIERPTDPARASRLLDALSGRGLRQARARVAELAEFARE
ncbi:MAG: hypothetical protein R3B48_30240 [Kofleriaceae bacterium]